ncbi:hypothetical protein A9Q91_02360 [Candidatus Gracilibacteria bacterium 28_42_T64]|nr:hypothetical protein A9Q91_02360 [Candidatus Gracilibacteria bacterium 28_42_T64]
MLRRFLCFLFVLASIGTFAYAEELKYNTVELKEKFDAGEISEEEIQNIISESLNAGGSPSLDPEGKLETIDGVEYYIDIKTGEKSIILTSDEANTKNHTTIINKYDGLETLIGNMKMEVLKEINMKQDKGSQEKHIQYMLGVLFALIILNSAGIIYLIFKRK